MAKDVKTVRYQVVAPTFVNGSYIDPQGRKDVFVMAPPGLAGRALKIAAKGGVPVQNDEGQAGDDGEPKA